MVISFRTTDEEGLRIREFASSKDLKVSELAREAINHYISEAEAELLRAEEKKRRQERIAQNLKQLEKYSGFMANTPIAKLSDEEVRDLWRLHNA